MVTMLQLAAAALLFSQLLVVYGASDEKEQEVAAVLRRMESEVLAFRDEIERVYASRCDVTTLSTCSQSNYNDCSSTYPNQQCMTADESIVSACGDGITCNALNDKTQTAVRVPSSLMNLKTNNPNDPNVIESICYSRLAEEYMVDNYSTGNQMYFGSADGSFRIIPARHSEVCGEYDPRRRPWFVAGSSGPKDVVLVIDVSGSMDDYGRMGLAKNAATTIIDTLTVADRVAIIAFSGEATQIGDIGNASSLIRATAENKRVLIDAISGLEANGATNFYAAFEKAFGALDNTIRNEATSGCNIAVLFLTDGQITEGPKEDEVISLVNNRTAQLAEDFNRKTTIFTFSLGYQADHTVTKSIACATTGIWTPVEDFSDDLVKEMSSYYKLYALGLGEGGNEDFTAWVEPYTFHTGGVMGTSVSTPVYDRSTTPPHFLGVVALDMKMDEIEEILGEEASSSTMLDRFIMLSTARCPKIELSEFELEALRFVGGEEEVMCQEEGEVDTTASFSGVVLPIECGFDSDLPNDLWDNTDMEGKSYEERACCEIGGTEPSINCPLSENTTPLPDQTMGETMTTAEPVREPSEMESPMDISINGESEVKSEISASSSGSGGSSQTGMIVGIVVGVVAAVLIATVLYVVWRRKNSDPVRRMSSMGSPIDESVAVMMPSAPPLNPAAFK